MVIYTIYYVYEYENMLVVSGCPKYITTSLQRIANESRNLLTANVLDNVIFRLRIGLPSTNSSRRCCQEKMFGAARTCTLSRVV